MVYLTSDLHGYPLGKFKTMLERVGFSDSDTLYVLGDCIDRGSDGINILLWLMNKRNATLIAGNHEDMMLTCDFLFESDYNSALSSLTPKKLNEYAVWMSNSGRPTLDALQTLNAAKAERLFDFIRQAPIYVSLNVNGREFLLTHSGLGSFSEDRDISQYSRYDLLWNRPGMHDEYYDDKTVVFGHTPTVYYSEDYKGRALKTRTWIDIDVGAGLGLNPMLFRLDDMQEFYFDDDINIISE